MRSCTSGSRVARFAFSTVTAATLSPREIAPIAPRAVTPIVRMGSANCVYYPDSKSQLRYWVRGFNSIASALASVAPRFSPVWVVVSRHKTSPALNVVSDLVPSGSTF